MKVMDWLFRREVPSIEVKESSLILIESEKPKPQSKRAALTALPSCLEDSEERQRYTENENSQNQRNRTNALFD